MKFTGWGSLTMLLASSRVAPRSTCSRIRHRCAGVIWSNPLMESSPKMARVSCSTRSSSVLSLRINGSSIFPPPGTVAGLSVMPSPLRRP